MWKGEKRGREIEGRKELDHRPAFRGGGEKIIYVSNLAREHTRSSLLLLVLIIF